MSGGWKNPHEVASKKGLRVLEPEDFEAFVDLDTEEAHALFQEQIKVLIAHEPGVEAKVRPSPSGEPGHYHAVVRFRRKLSEVERVAVQAALGSDAKRELLCLLQAWEEWPWHTVLFEKPEVAAEVLDETAAWEAAHIAEQVAEALELGDSPFRGIT